jgi:hypothetical protein
VTEGTGITVSGTSIAPVINIDYVGTDNAILSATQYLGTDDLLDTDVIWFNDASNAVANTVSYAQIGSLPFDDYVDWKLQGDSGTNQDITKQTVVDFAGGTYITTATTVDTLTINHDATTRTSNTSTASPAFGATVTMFDDLQTNGTGHVTISNLKTVTLPSPVNFTPSPTSVDAGAAGYVPAPAAGTGSTSYFLNGTGAMSIPPNDDGVTAVTATAPISSTGGDTPVISHNNVLTDAGGTIGTYDSVTVDAKGHVTAGTNQGGKGGTFTGSSALTDGVQGNLFTLTRANTGTLMFDVWLTSGDNTTESICKRYTVARSYSVTTPPYNKLIDTGPVSGNDFAVSFVGDATTGVICKVTPSGTNQTISYTVVVGYDSVNTLTVS